MEKLDDIKDLLDVPVDELKKKEIALVVRYLRSIRERLPNLNPNVSRLEDVLLPLVNHEREKDKLRREEAQKTTMDSSTFIEPKLQDLFLLDIFEEDLYKSIAFDLSVEYLKPSHLKVEWPVMGTLFGANMRPFVNLLVRDNSNRSINVIFLIAPNVPTVHLSATAMKALTGWVKSICINVNIHGIGIETYLSPPDSHFAHINVIGSDYLHTARATLKLEYKHLSLVLDKEK